MIVPLFAGMGSVDLTVDPIVVSGSSGGALVPAPSGGGMLVPDPKPRAWVPWAVGAGIALALWWALREEGGRSSNAPFVG